MYYPDEILEQVRAGNDIVDVVGSYVHLKKQGANYFGLCPFHNEKSPSFSVSADKQIFYCFGCGAGGNVITFLMKYENYSFQEAVKALAERAGIRLPEAEYGEEAKKREQHRRELFDINREAATYYYRMLRSPRGAAGMRYLEGRGLTAETIHRFGLGFADGSGSDLVAFLRKKGFPDDSILESGVAAYDEKRGLHDKFWNRVMFPIMDVNSRVIGFGGRVMGDGKPKYLNSPETPIFDKGRNLYGLHLAKRSRTEQFILCEGYMDVIAMHQAGFPQAVASLGTAFTSGQASILKRYAKEILLSYDSDEAGMRAALRNNGILREAALRSRVLDLRPYKDPDEFMKNLGADEFRKRIDAAENSFFYELRMLERNFAMDDPAGRTDFCREAAKRLGVFEDEIERDNYIEAVAARYFIDKGSLRRMVGSYTEAGELIRAPERPKPAAPRKKEGGITPETRAQAWLLTWMAEDRAVFAQVSRYIRPEDFAEGIPRTVAERFYADPKPGSIAAIISVFPEESEQNRAATLFNSRFELPEGRENQEKALHDVVLSVKQSSGRRRAAELAGDPNALQEIIRSKKELEELKTAVFCIDTEKGREQDG
ncbi:DNA primase [Lachnoclostridium sp. Marseille-P6806]|uniref:DNA primase n=1 Tax=Lachnoclostridium sp. Marseille-P6806 TaxID=2364793 RepID=UPI001031E0D3|nr:DNA primase [Lachnoclostridium sp. Marseille-P6806]